MSAGIFMRRAVDLSRTMMERGAGGPFGAVIVKDGKIIAEGFNRVTTSNDPTAHAEIVAIRAACESLAAFSLRGCEIYTSCEPCPMCLAAIYWARIPTVYYANTRADAAAIGFDDDFIYRQVPLPPEQRAIKMTPLLRAAAQVTFQAWAKKTDKVRY